MHSDLKDITEPSSGKARWESQWWPLEGHRYTKGKDFSRNARLLTLISVDLMILSFFLDGNKYIHLAKWVSKSRYQIHCSRDGGGISCWLQPLLICYRILNTWIQHPASIHCGETATLMVTLLLNHLLVSLFSCCQYQLSLFYWLLVFLPYGLFPCVFLLNIHKYSFIDVFKICPLSKWYLLQ